MNQIENDEIVSIEEQDFIDMVDISVSGNNLFFANDILTHNCGFGEINPGLETISESIGLAATADFVCSLTQSEEDREISIMRFNILKNRFGPKFGSQCMKIDYPTLRITEDDTLNEDNFLSDSSNTLSILSRQ